MARTALARQDQVRNLAPQLIGFRPCDGRTYVRMARSGPRYSEAEARRAVAESMSFSEALRRLGMRAAGGNHLTLKKYVELWQIPTDHFDPLFGQRRALGRRQITPLEEILVEHSNYSRGSLKKRLYAAALKHRACELCGQGELWRGRRMALILDHVNGVATDHRLENLRIVCPNCAATLDTHCGRNLRARQRPRVRGVRSRIPAAPRRSALLLAATAGSTTSGRTSVSRGRRRARFRGPRMSSSRRTSRI